MNYSHYQTCAVRPQIPLSEWDIMSSLPTALVIINSQGRIVWLNPTAEAMLGYGLLDSLWLDVLLRAFVPRADDGHEVSLADGRRVHVAIATLDSLPGNLISLTDITASRDYEQEREHEKKLASIGTMTAQLAHQIRTPLASATLYMDHVQQNLADDERMLSWVQRVKECHSSIEQQIQDLLLFARGTTIKPTLTDLGYWCDQVVERAQPYVTRHRIKLLVQNRLISVEKIIHGESLLGAVLNLVINAIQSEATIIHLTLASCDSSGIQISVEDNGRGMSGEVLNQAFSPFFTTKAKGTGLGLAVVYAVVKAHGGRVNIESTEHVGTQVHLYLP
ncbi:MAG: PAS domain-containing sensor histidine kinase [Legionella sp. 40-6]|nr:ATP-binding protein [Legionella sp.]OJY50167.1 MAG: PAS domain-containing sensor histidine kinase [Legionella sp. 40-6]